MRYTTFADNNDVCWQYKVKQNTSTEDFNKYGLSKGDISIKDLSFRYIPKTSKKVKDISNFIERYEWLGKMPVWVTHRFGAYYKDILVCAVVLATPNSFSNLLGKENKNKEKLISRGASTSFAPKNVGSWTIMQSIRWMAKNTDFVLFTAYSDPMANELGTVYQACNFIYLGNTYGGDNVFINKETEQLYGSSYFNQRSVIKKVAVKAGVLWQDDYIKPNKTGSKRIINWKAMPDRVKRYIKLKVKEEKESNYSIIKTKPKHKYAYILGRDKTHTKYYNDLFKTINPDLVGLPYPTIRGD
jgi:hypothetical protein